MGNDYYTNYNPSVASTHDWRTVQACLPFMQQHLVNGKNLKILDVGCGPGSITNDVYENYGNANTIVGIDTPPELIRECISKYCGGNEQVVNKKNRNSLKFAQGSAYKLPFPDGEFDIVYCHQVLIHLKNPAAALQEMQRVLKRNGTSTASPSHLFVCEAEMRSFFVYPLSYQPAITDFFELETSQYTRRSFGLSLLELFQSSVKDCSLLPEKISLNTVSWCISDDARKKHFATMYINRIASKNETSELQRYIDAWTNWSNDPISTAALLNGFLTVTY